jgi:uncharacterized protein involved in copper resistance
LTSTSLAERKSQLRNELMALKEKLGMKSLQEQPEPKQQNKNASEAASEDGREKTAPTKEGLERRKAEAQTVMDISHWKHSVSKQEHLLEQVTTKINNKYHNNNNNNNTGHAATNYKKCLHKRHATNKAIARVQHELDVIEQRQKVVEDGIVWSTQQLLEARHVLYQERTREQRAENK